MSHLKGQPDKITLDGKRALVIASAKHPSLTLVVRERHRPFRLEVYCGASDTTLSLDKHGGFV